jgi:type I restriction enzyme, S subunit
VSAWKTASLGEIFDIARGGSPRPIQDYITDGEDGVNWISISDASASDKFITETKKRIRPEGVSRSRMVKPGDFLLTNSMSFGRPYIMGTSGCIHDGWLVLSSKHGDVDQDYFFHLLGSDFIYAKFTKLAAGATVKNLNIDLVSGVEVNFPPLEEQRRIAAILDQAETLRTQRRQALAHLDTLTQSLFLDMFGDPVANDRGWPMAAVSDFVAGFESGKSLVADDEDDSTSVFRVLKVSAVTSLEYKPEQSKAVPSDYVPPKSHIVRAGDLLFSRANTTELIGATAFVAATPDNLLLPDKLWRFVWHQPTRTAPLYVRHLFQQPKFRQEIGQRASGTSGSMKNISHEKVLSIRVGNPPLTLQQTFATRIQAIEALKATHRTALAQLDALFASLQQRAFAGEL